MTVYAIALLNIADRERYGAYQQGFRRMVPQVASAKVVSARPMRRNAQIST
jgi:hypothetical protein